MMVMLMMEYDDDVYDFDEDKLLKHLATTFSQASQSKNDGSFVFLNNLKI